jgi:hypothetical protein
MPAGQEVHRAERQDRPVEHAAEEVERPEARLTPAGAVFVKPCTSGTIGMA